MIAALRPVKAAPRDSSIGTAESNHVDVPSLEKHCALLCDRVFAGIEGHDQFVIFEAGSQRDSQLSGDMVVARSRKAYLFAFADWFHFSGSGNHSQSLDGMCYLGSGDSVISMSPLGRYLDKAAVPQLGEMHAG